MSMLSSSSVHASYSSSCQTAVRSFKFPPFLMQGSRQLGGGGGPAHETGLSYTNASKIYTHSNTLIIYFGHRIEPHPHLEAPPSFPD